MAKTELAAIEQAVNRIKEAKLIYGDIPLFVGFSGGKDSLTAINVVMQHFEATAFHANTGIGSEVTREFVRNTCRENNWPLEEIRAKEDAGQDYEEIVKQHGFPGPGQHSRMYIRLKERCIRVLRRRHKKKRGGKIMMVTGIREDESSNRAGYKDQEIKENEGVVWVNAIYEFTGQDVYNFISDNNIQTNPVSDIVGFSCECACGAFAHPGEKELIRKADPELAQRLDKLEREVKEHGFDWKWEDKPPTKKERELRKQKEMPFCNGCTK